MSAHLCGVCVQWYDDDEHDECPNIGAPEHVIPFLRAELTKVQTERTTLARRLESAEASLRNVETSSLEAVDRLTRERDTALEQRKIALTAAAAAKRDASAETLALRDLLERARPYVDEWAARDDATDRLGQEILDVTEFGMDAGDEIRELRARAENLEASLRGAGLETDVCRERLRCLIEGVENVVLDLQDWTNGTGGNGPAYPSGTEAGQLARDLLARLSALADAADR